MASALAAERGGWRSAGVHRSSVYSFGGSGSGLGSISSSPSGSVAGSRVACSVSSVAGAFGGCGRSRAVAPCAAPCCSEATAAGVAARAISHQTTSTSARAPSSSGGSGRQTSHVGLALRAGWRASQRHVLHRAPRDTAARALFEPPPFKPSKLDVSFAGGAGPNDPPPQPPATQRRYTLTHNDLTGQLWLTVGPEYNQLQISGFYTRLLRDEVTAEWRSGGADGAGPSLHVFCHVSGEERWLAPPVLRNYIFRREMPLVLDCVLYAEKQLLRHNPILEQANVYIHFESSVQALNSVENWGVLGERSTWQAVPTSILKRIVYGAMGMPLELSPGGDLPALLPVSQGAVPVVATATAVSQPTEVLCADAAPVSGASVPASVAASAAAASGDMHARSTSGRMGAGSPNGNTARRRRPSKAGHVADVTAAAADAVAVTAAAVPASSGSQLQCAPVAAVVQPSEGEDVATTVACVEDQASGMLPGCEGILTKSLRKKPAQPALVSTRK